MANLLAETGINVFQHFESQTPATTQTDLPACVVGPLYQKKYDEPVTIKDTSIYSSVAGVYDVNTKYLDDANLPEIVPTTMKVLISSPASLAGVYNITEFDSVLKRIKISSDVIIPTIGGSNVVYSIYNPSKSYMGYGISLGFPGILKFSDNSKNPDVDTSSVIVKISDVNGDHTVPTAASKAVITNATLTNASSVVKLAISSSQDITGVNTNDCVYVQTPSDVNGFYKILAINLAEEQSTIVVNKQANRSKILTAGNAFGFEMSFALTPYVSGTALVDSSDQKAKFVYKNVGGSVVADAITSANYTAASKKITFVLDDSKVHAGDYVTCSSTINDVNAIEQAVGRMTFTTSWAMAAAANLLTAGSFFSIFDAAEAETKVWFEVEGAGTAPSGSSVVKVTVPFGATTADIATLAKNAIGALATKFSASVTLSTSTVTVENVADASAPDILDGSTATTFTFDTVVQGEKSLTLAPEASIIIPASTTSVSATIYSSGKLVSSTGFILTSNIPYKGTVKVSYRALRNDLYNQFIKLQYQSELVNLAGTNTIDDPDNPLVFGLYMAIVNSGETRQVYGLAIGGDTATDHASAVEFLQLRKEAYSVVPLTQELAYIEMYKNHVLSVSAPEERWESIAFLNRAIPTYATLTTNGSVNGPAVSNVVIENVDADNFNLVNSSPNSDFYVYGITTDHLLRMVIWDSATSTKSVIECPVAAEPSLADKTKIKFTITGATMGDFEFPVNLSSITVFKYEVITEKFDTVSAADKARQAQEITSWLAASASASVSSDGNSTRRIVYVLPDLIEVPTSLGTMVVPAYFLACGAAGYKSALAPHMPIAENGLSGVSKVFHSTDYFSNIQIRTMESAGAMFFYQPTDVAAPRARRDITNDVSTLKTMSLGTVSVIDLFSKKVRARLSRLVAKNVMNDNLINTGKLFTAAVISEFNNNGWWKGGEITQFIVNPNAPDRLLIKIKPDTFDPFNGADCHIYV